MRRTLGITMDEGREERCKALSYRAKARLCQNRESSAARTMSSPLFAGRGQLSLPVNERGDKGPVVPSPLAAVTPFNLSGRVVHSPLGMG